MTIIQRYPLDKPAKYRLHPEEASEEMIEFMKSFGAVAWDIELFISPDNFIMPPHTDACFFGDYAKINFAYCENENHTMDWYEPLTKPKIINPAYGDNAQGTSHFIFTLDDVKLIHKEKIDVAFVNVGVIHGVTTEKKRQCVTFIIDIEVDGKVEELTMSNCPENLKRYFL